MQNQSANLSVGVFQQKLDAFKVKIESQQLQVRSLTAEFESLVTEFKSLKQLFDISLQKFDTTSSNFDTTSRKFDTTSSNFDTTSEKVDTTSPNFDTTSEKVDTTSPNFDTTSGKFNTTLPNFNSSSGKFADKSIEPNLPSPNDDASSTLRELSLLIWRSARESLHIYYSQPNIPGRMAEIILNLLKKKKLSLAEMRQITGASRISLARDIRILKLMGWLEFHGSRKNGYYTLTATFPGLHRS